MVQLQQMKPQDIDISDPEQVSKIDAAIGSPTAGSAAPSNPKVTNALRDSVAGVMRYNHLGEGSAAQAVLALVKPTQIDANGGDDPYNPQSTNDIPFRVQELPNDPYGRVRITFKDGLQHPIFLSKDDLPVIDTLRGLAAQKQLADTGARRSKEGQRGNKEEALSQAVHKRPSALPDFSQDDLPEASYLNGR